MATVYGDTVNHFRAFLTYETTETDTNVTITAEAGFESVAWGFQLNSGVTTTITCTNQSSVSGSGGFYSATGATVQTVFARASYTIAKTTLAQTVTLGVSTVNTSGYMNGTSSTSVNISIKSLAGFDVKYDANGGSGAPSDQTKYFGVDLKLSSTKPTRSGYTFLGWATSSGGSVVYQPGDTYTANSSVTLYAQWSLDYIVATISSFSVKRCDSTGASAADGTYANVSASWEVHNGVNPSRLEIDYRLTSETTWTTGWSTSSPGAQSGTVSQIIGGGNLDPDSAYVIRFIVTESQGSAYAQITMQAQFYVLDFGNKGKSIGMGCAAPDDHTGLDIGMVMRFMTQLHEVSPYITIGDPNPGGATSYGIYLCDSTDKRYANFRGYQSANDVIGSEMFAVRDVYGKTVFNGLRFTIDERGNKSAYMIGEEDAAIALCSAIGALRPQVLYDNPEGTTSSVSLSSSAADFSRLEIYILCDGVYGVLTTYEPNGKTVDLSLQYRDNNNSSICLIKTRLVLISGFSISNVRAGNYHTGAESGVDNTSVEIRITRVLGYV